MLDRDFLRPILDDDSLTRGIGDEEARLLIEWLVEQAENLATDRVDLWSRKGRLAKLCRRVRTISRFVQLWCHERDFGAAVQLAGAEAVPWTLPFGPEDATELTIRLLRAEEQWLTPVAA